MSDYNIIIIGGGISGLNCCYKLSNENKKILLLERLPRFGGRIISEKVKVNDKSFLLEHGAARFHDNHTFLKNLINELNLTNDIIEYPSKLKEGDNIISIIETISNKILNYPKIKTNNMTYIDFVKKYETNNTHNIIKKFTYYDALYHGNCIYMAKTVLKNYNKDKYFTLKNGLQQITDRLSNKLKKCKNVTIKLNSNVNDVVKQGRRYVLKINESNIEKEYLTDKIIFAVPGKIINNYHIFEKNKKLFDSVYYKNMNRIYAILNDKDNYFFKNGLINTKEKIKTITCFKNEKCLISYCDGECADYWYNKNKNNDMNDLIHRNMKKIYKKSHKPKLIKNYYWYESLAVWKPNYNFENIIKKMINPIKNIFICGDTFSDNQCWIEGALSTSNSVIKLCKKSNKNKTRKNTIKQNGGNKIYSMNEVKKHNKINDGWVVIKNKVYNVTNFINQHPGGSQILSDRLGKDITSDFNARGHPDYVEKTILPKYLIGRIESKTRKN